MSGKMTPMMLQYMEIKEKYKHCILFYRLGDFYEMFFEDAIIASKELEITLTGKDCGLEERAPMCGVPFHSADSYIAKLIERGYKVAICEQVEDPKTAKGIVKRDVIRIVTPGTVLDTNVLDESKNNYLMCIYADARGFGVATCDATTGDFIVSEFGIDDENKVIDVIAMYTPAEIIANELANEKFYTRVLNIFDIKISLYEEWVFEYQYCNILLCNHFKVLNLSGYGIENSKNCVISAGALMNYLIETQKGKLGHILGIRKYAPNEYMVLDISSRRNLELTENVNDRKKRGSLLWVLDKTKTAMGARLLRNWIEQPLIDKPDIEKRLSAVEEIKNKVFEREDLKELLNSIYDIERLMSKVSYGTANAKDLIALRDSFEYLPQIKSVLSGFESEYFTDICREFDTLEDIYTLVFDSIKDDPPFTLREGGLIKEGYNTEVDELTNAKKEGSSWLIDLETKEKEATGIKKLRIKYNRVFGYFIEVTNSFKDMVPERYIRKQTLANAERYITPELKEIEDKILGADDRLVDLEYSIFTEIRERISRQITRIQKTASLISQTDVLQSLGEVAEKNNYVRPKINTTGEINIVNGRHPVVELAGSEEFIPNDTYLDLKNDVIAIITGPNMAGKSTYMRQVALIVLMAQLGSFVPCESADIGITDRIFTRVGASDDLATGQSTFMVEMVEVANILNNATRNSLLILDEIGRGTSTYDGLSIAWAVMEYISKKIGARSLFATHYHELTDLQKLFDNIKNCCVSVKEEGEEVIFLRKIIDGATDRSYGVHVAKLAGIPKSVVKRANKILAEIDKDKVDIDAPAPDFYDENEDNEIASELLEKLKNVDVDAVTPKMALEILYELKDIVKNN